ncbi:MAG TPA: hypothetical protein VGO96_09305 [Pyrinomonadaceae bacterium]|jgi:hypothetical protein|nr:hypothetical protein [Pyrinomonadaceae bacterium]
MQFTVLIEFLVPGLATTLLLLFILPDGAVPKPPLSLPTGETASALLLLAVSYPVGILTNFPLFLLQRRVMSRNIRRRIFEKYAARGFDLAELVNKQFGITASNLPIDYEEKLQSLVHLMSVFVFSKNVERMHSNHIYHEGLQRLARGILPPLLLAGYVVSKNQTPSWFLLVAICVLLAASACSLLYYSINAEYEQIAGYFITLTNIEKRTAAKHPKCLDESSAHERSGDGGLKEPDDEEGDEGGDVEDAERGDDAA